MVKIDLSKLPPCNCPLCNTEMKGKDTCYILCPKCRSVPVEPKKKEGDKK